MQRFEIAHEFACTPERYIAVIDGAAFHERLCVALDLKERRLVERREESDAIVVTWHVVPRRELPAPVQKVLGPSGMAYYEEERRPHGTFERLWRIRMDAFDERRFRCEGTFNLLPAGPGMVQRRLLGEIRVKLFGVGGIVERGVVKAIRESYEHTTRLVNELLAQTGQPPS